MTASRLFFGLLTLLCTTSSFLQAMPLADQGQALKTIVLPERPTPAEETAARELATFLQQVTGASFSIVSESQAPATDRLLVGNSHLAQAMLVDNDIPPLTTHEILIQTAGSDLLLLGGHPRSTREAVHTFLHEPIGCRWLTWWGDTFIPHTPALRIGSLQIRQTPTFQIRDIVTHNHRTADWEKLRDFLMRNRASGPELANIPGMDALGGTEPAYVHPRLAHTFFRFIPKSEFETHPDYFSFLEGKRVPKQLCFSHPQVRSRILDQILNNFEKAGGRGVLSLSAEDIPGPLCQCAPCAAMTDRHGTPGAPLFHFLAELSPVLADAYPEARVASLAYRLDQTEVPPQDLHLPANIAMTFAPIDSDFSSPLTSARNQQTHQHLRAWSQAADNLWIWYYPYSYRQAMPIGNLHRLREDFRLFAELGVEGFFIEQDAPGTHDARRMVSLQTWLITQLMWNPSQDFDALIDDFLLHYYGAAAPWMKQFVERQEAATEQMSTRMNWVASLSQHRFLTADLLLELQRLLDQAEQAVADAPQNLARVRYARMSVDLACIELWDRQDLAAHRPLDFQQILERYATTYRHVIDDRIRPAIDQARIVSNDNRHPTEPKRYDRLLSELDNFLRWRRLKSPLKPLTAPLNRIPSHRIRQITPETAYRHQNIPTLVEDTQAATGIAVRFEIDGSQPFNMGYYEQGTAKQHPTHLSRDEIRPGIYQLYSLGTHRLHEADYVWLDRLWYIQFHDVAEFFDPDHPQRRWQIWASIRFEGPSYGTASSPEEKDRLYVDRIVLVQER